MHANLTLNQAKNFDILQKQQAYLVSWREDELHHLDYLKNSQFEILNQIKSIQGIHNQTVTEIQSILGILLVLEDQVNGIIEKYNQLVHDHIHDLAHQIKGIELYQQSKVQGVVNSMAIYLETMNSHLSKMVAVQEGILDNWNQTQVKLWLLSCLFSFNL